MNIRTCEGHPAVSFLHARSTDLVIGYELNRKSSRYLIRLQKGSLRLRNVRQILFTIITGLVFYAVSWQSRRPKVQPTLFDSPNKARCVYSLHCILYKILLLQVLQRAVRRKFVLKLVDRNLHLAKRNIWEWCFSRQEVTIFDFR